MPNNIPHILHSDVVLNNDYFQVRKDRLQITPRDTYDYYSLDAPPYAVMVLATTDQGEYVLNWEYRHPVKKVLLSCPGGIMHAGESPTDCASRELTEETGYSADHFEMLGEAHPFPGICSQKTYYVRAYGAKLTGPQQLDLIENIETELFTPTKLQKALSGQFPIDGLLLSALYLASIK